MKNTTKLNLEVITPLHVGSGRILEWNQDYIRFDKHLAILDEAKMFDVIGEDQMEIWLTAISENKDIKSYLESRKNNLEADDVSRRQIRIRQYVDGVRQVREQIHDGAGYPYIPGSSIKGAVRTAWLSKQILSKANPIPALYDYANFKNKFGSKLKDEKIQAAVAGKDPNHDLFRLLRIADVRFEETKLFLAETLSIYGNGDKAKYKNEVRQLVEGIDIGAKAELFVSIPEDLKSAVQKERLIPKAEMITIQNLFDVINKNTLEIIEAEEIDRWKEVEVPEPAEKYLEYMNDISKRIQSVGKGECYLRMGFGSGFNFMTGAWQSAFFGDRGFDQFEEELNKAVRGIRYMDFMLPKTRKMVMGGIPMGFIKLSY